MPIYEYRCGACGHEHEALRKVSEPPLTKCPACGKPKLKKLLSAAGFQLKGSGWYATDFKGGSSNKPAEKKAEDKNKKSESKTEPSKTETKTDAKPASSTATSD
jgi:putative FmdB family regulatory protein